MHIMNDRVRIYELARKMSLENQLLIDAFRELGYDVKSHSSTVDAHAVGLVIAHIGKKKQSKPAAEPKVTAAPKPTAGHTKSTSRPAQPPIPVVKPRVLARYRPVPQPLLEGEVSAEPASQSQPTTLPTPASAGS